MDENQQRNGARARAAAHILAALAASGPEGAALAAVKETAPFLVKVALMDELSAFSNQTARFRNAERAFLFAGDSCRDVLTELEHLPGKEDAKLLDYGGVYRCLQLPIHLLSCDITGAVQLQIMSVPDYRTRLTKAALKAQYHPPPSALPALRVTGKLPWPPWRDRRSRCCFPVTGIRGLPGCSSSRRTPSEKPPAGSRSRTARRAPNS